MRKACLIVAALVLSLSGGAYSIDLGAASQAQAPVPNGYLYGIDVSGHQGSINWTSLKSAKDFALIKASEGVNWADPWFYTNRTAARNSGILRGWYHYARPDLGNTGIGEADSFVNIVGPLQPGELLMLDYEPEQSTPGYDNPNAVAWCKAWLDEVYAKTGVKPMMYLYTWLINHYNWSPVISAGYPLNYAYVDLNSNPTTPKPPQWPYAIIKQYDWHGTCAGITGEVDLDSFYSDVNAWMNLGGCPAAPTITQQPQSQAVCNGASATFTVAATTSQGSLSYQWRSGGTNIPGATSASYTTGTAGSYDCVVSGRCYSTTSNAATLTLNPATSISSQPAVQRVAYGSKGTFSVVASGTSISYQWRRNGVAISGATSSSYQTGNPGTYDCVVSGSCGSVTSSSAGLLINNATWVSSVAAAKQLADGTVVGMSQGPTVTRGLSSFYYVEDFNRAAAIKIIPNGPANALSDRSVATIYGIIQYYGGERVIGGGLVNGTGSGPQPEPLGMTCRSAVLPIAQGQYVRMAGTASIPQGSTFTLSDGSGSITVMLYGAALPADGDFVNVRGVLGCESFGPVLRIIKPTDLW